MAQNIDYPIDEWIIAGHFTHIKCGKPVSNAGIKLMEAPEGRRMHGFKPVAGLTEAQDYFGLKTEQRLVKDEVVLQSALDPYAAIMEAARMISSTRHERRAHNEMDFADDGRLVPAL